jgi:ComEC/Rec2-related protein
LAAFFFTLFNSLVFKRLGRIIFAVLAGVLFGALRTTQINQDRLSATDYIEGKHDIEISISNNPILKNDSWRFESNSVFINGEQKRFFTYVSIPAQDFALETGDKLTLRAKPSTGFGKYSLSIARPELILISKPDPPSLFLKLRNWFSSELERLFGAQNTDELALALGYLTGQKTFLSDELNEKLKIVGLSHVIVASGFHLGIIVNLAKRCFGKLSRFGVLFAATIAIVCFVSITGLSASMLRAALICVLSLFAWYFVRKFHPARLLLFAAAISLTINPLYALDVAWQLSFASFAGLLLLAPLIKEFFYGQEKPGFIPESLIQSCSAQLCCLPLSIYTFGSFSIIGLISNLLISPSIPLVMLLSLLAVIFSPVRGLGDFIVFVATHLLRLHIFIIEKLSSLKFGFIELENGNTATLLLFLVPIILFVFLKLRTKFDFRPLFVRPPLLEKSQKYGRIYSC